jgi:hypothetical protein
MEDLAEDESESFLYQNIGPISWEHHFVNDLTLQYGETGSSLEKRRFIYHDTVMRQLKEIERMKKKSPYMEKQDLLDTWHRRLLLVEAHCRRNDEEHEEEENHEEGKEGEKKEEWSGSSWHQGGWHEPWSSWSWQQGGEGQWNWPEKEEMPKAKGKGKGKDKGKSKEVPKGKGKKGKGK